jgi:GntR family transcriptional regulator
VFKVDTASFVPIYEQIKQETVRLRAAGALKAHDPLPSIRDLAAELLVNPNTVARAYRELEQAGLIYTQKGRGSFLADHGRIDLKMDRLTRVAQILDEAVALARGFDLDADDVRQLLEERLKRKDGAAGRGGRHE